MSGNRGSKDNAGQLWVLLERFLFLGVAHHGDPIDLLFAGPPPHHQLLLQVARKVIYFDFGNFRLLRFQALASSTLSLLLPSCSRLCL